MSQIRQRVSEAHWMQLVMLHSSHRSVELLRKYPTVSLQVRHSVRLEQFMQKESEQRTQESAGRVMFVEAGFTK